jgi:hypothetical protein
LKRIQLQLKDDAEFLLRGRIRILKNVTKLSFQT